MLITIRPFPDFNNPALTRLIRRKYVLHEVPSLILEIFSCKGLDDTIRRLSKDDVQAFVDVIDEVRHASTSSWMHPAEPALTGSVDQLLDRPDFSLWVRVKCVRPLYRTCGRYELLPQALKVPIYYDRSGYPLYHGGYADVWKGTCYNRDVAVKIISTCETSNFKRVISVSC